MDHRGLSPPTALGRSRLDTYGFESSLDAATLDPERS